MNELSPYLKRADLPERNIENGGNFEELHTPSLQDYWRIVKKRRWAILGVASVVMFTVAIITVSMTPIYTAETTLLIDPTDPLVVDIKQVRTESVRVDDYYATQYEMLKSRSLIAQVIDEQKLHDHPAYQRKPVGFLTRLKEQVFASKEKVENGIHAELIRTYLDRILEVKPMRNSRLVTIDISTPDPELSARLANAHAAKYISEGLNLRTKANKAALGTLEKKLGDLKNRLRISEAALNKFRREKGILSLGDKENVIVDRLADLNRRLTEAEVDRISLEAQAALIRHRQYDSLPAVISSILIQNLKKQVSALEIEYANMDVLYTHEHPKMAQLKAQLDESRKRLDKEIKNVVGGIQSAFMSAESKERTLRENMEKQKTAALNLKDAAVEYAVLAREADTNRLLYDNVLQRIRELGVSAELRASNITVVDAAVVPDKPAKPKKWLYFGVSALIGITGGLGLAFLREYFDNRMQTPEDVERCLHLPSIAVVPEFSKLKSDPVVAKSLPAKMSPNARRSRKELVLLRHPHSAIHEVYSMLHTSILLSRAEEPPRCLLFASAQRGEGKTVNVLNTGIVISRAGARTLIVDADLRASRCARVLGLDNQLGLTEVLTGQANLHDVIQPTGIDFLSLISSGTIPPMPAALLGSQKMHEVLTVLRQHFEFILIDSSPIIPVTDAVRLAPLVDGVIVVVNSHLTPSHVVKEAYSRLKYARADVLGVLLNHVDITDQKIFDYYPSSYYTARA